MQLSPQVQIQLNNQWRVARILNLSPFDEEVLKLNKVQVDWIFTMYEKDNPGSLKVEKPISPILMAMKRWNDVLMGDALRKFMQSKVPDYLKENVTSGE